jgi:hypothetical protein
VKEDIKKDWVDALRSGKYKQVQGYLHKADGYCCLGVLCDVMGVLSSDHLQTKLEKDTEVHSYFYKDSKMTEDLSREFMLEVGLSPDEADTLMAMNDASDSFIVIADHIEKYL